MTLRARRRRDTGVDVVDRLLVSYENSPAAMQQVNSYNLPSKEEVARIVEQCRTLIFPGFVGPSLVRATRTELRESMRQRVGELRYLLRRQIYRGLHHKAQRERGTNELDCPHCASRAEVIAETFVEGLVDMRSKLARDLDANYRADPAATGTDEVIFCYPGFYAVTVYRLAHALQELGARFIPRMMGELAHEKTGIDIHPGAEIGESFFIDHGTGVVIGETTVIGDRVRIYQGVTLGALSVHDRAAEKKKRHPTIGDDVIIYSGATILGGDTEVGEGAIIGGNCWVTNPVPAGAVVTQNGLREKSDTHNTGSTAGSRP